MEFFESVERVLTTYRHIAYQNDPGVNCNFLGYYGFGRRTLLEDFLTKMSFPLLIQQISWSYIDVLYIKMILVSISTFLATGAFVDEHF